MNIKYRMTLCAQNPCFRKSFSKFEGVSHHNFAKKWCPEAENGLERRVRQFYTICYKNQLLNEKIVIKNYGNPCSQTLEYQIQVRAQLRSNVSIVKLQFV
jgi:hypothetical protein